MIKKITLKKYKELLQGGFKKAGHTKKDLETTVALIKQQNWTLESFKSNYTYCVQIRSRDLIINNMSTNEDNCIEQFSKGDKYHLANINGVTYLIHEYNGEYNNNSIKVLSHLIEMGKVA